MKRYCINNLYELRSLILSLDKDQYQFKSHLLSGATIGQHIRHILEFYQCLLASIDTGKVNYDNRKRSQEVETDPKKAISFINNTCQNLSFLNSDKNLNLQGNFTEEKFNKKTLVTSVGRELAYCLEHSIHHQALIKVALMEQGALDLIDLEFGIAPSTIRKNKTLISKS